MRGPGPLGAPEPPVWAPGEAERKRSRLRQGEGA